MISLARSAKSTKKVKSTAEARRTKINIKVRKKTLGREYFDSDLKEEDNGKSD